MNGTTPNGRHLMIANAFTVEVMRFMFFMVVIAWLWSATNIRMQKIEGQISSLKKQVSKEAAK